MQNWWLKIKPKQFGLIFVDPYFQISKQYIQKTELPFYIDQDMVSESKCDSGFS